MAALHEPSPSVDDPDQRSQQTVAGISIALPTFSAHHAVHSAIEGITAPSVGRTTHLHPANDHLLRSILTVIMDHTTGHNLSIPKSITARISRKNPDDGQPATAHLRSATKHGQPTTIT
ncbi:hypothetical protein ACLOJK_027258, partial [Asimina triloba]